MEKIIYNPRQINPIADLSRIFAPIILAPIILIIGIIISAFLFMWALPTAWPSTSQQVIDLAMVIVPIGFAIIGAIFIYRGLDDAKTLDVPVGHNAVVTIGGEPRPSYEFSEGKFNLPALEFFSSSYQLGGIQYPIIAFPLDIHFSGFLQKQSEEEEQVIGSGIISVLIKITDGYDFVRMNAPKEFMGELQGLSGYLDDTLGGPILNTLSKLTPERFIGDSTMVGSESFRQILLTEIEQGNDTRCNIDKLQCKILIEGIGTSIEGLFLRKRELPQELTAAMLSGSVQIKGQKAYKAKGAIIKSLGEAFKDAGIDKVSPNDILVIMNEYKQESITKEVKEYQGLENLQIFGGLNPEAIEKIGNIIKDVFAKK